MVFPPSDVVGVNLCSLHGIDIGDDEELACGGDDDLDGLHFVIALAAEDLVPRNLRNEAIRVPARRPGSDKKRRRWLAGYLRGKYGGVSWVQISGGRWHERLLILA